ncbi:MAG TPA: hypothetical protein VIK01_12085 [Polyangiaceae bacterium]
MSKRRSSADLGPNLEAALSGFPFPERDWEQDAVAVEAKLSTGQLGGTDATLLAAPLPREPGEPGEPSAAPSATTTPLTHSGVRTQSLAEMARRSVENKQAAEREMARASLALAAQQQRPAVPPAAASTASAPKPVAAAPIANLSAPQASNAPSPWPKFGAAAAVIALAAGVLFWLRQPATPVPLVSTVLPTETPTSEAKPSNLAAPGAAPTPASVAQLTPSGIDPNSLPGENAAKPLDTAHEKPNAAAARTPTAGRPSAEKIVLEDEPEKAPAAAAAPVEKPVEKALPPDPALRPADSTGGAVPVKPSTGAVQAALGAVMSGARHCVAGEDAASSAVVVFSSDGRVQSVSVSGPAAGQSSGACIQAQLSRARVQPFAASSFSVSATVRPD